MEILSIYSLIKFFECNFRNKKNDSWAYDHGNDPDQKIYDHYKNIRITIEKYDPGYAFEITTESILVRSFEGKIKDNLNITYSNRSFEP